MYSRISNKTYRDAPFTDTQFTCGSNYIYRNVEVLAKLEVPDNSLGELALCRTVGILQSFHDQVFVCGINSTGGFASDNRIQVSMMYLKAPQSTVMLQLVMPCPVQLFGSIKWHSTKPVLYVKLIQVLKVPKVLQIKDTMDWLVKLQVPYAFKSHKS